MESTFVSARPTRAACLHTISIIAIEPVQRDDSHSGRSCKLACAAAPQGLTHDARAGCVQAPHRAPTRTQHRRATTSSTPHAHHNGPHAELRGPRGISGITTRAFGPVSSTLSRLSVVRVSQRLPTWTHHGTHHQRQTSIKPYTCMDAKARADQRWGLNSVEVFNTNNRTTVGSANNTSLTLEIFPQR